MYLEYSELMVLVFTVIQVPLQHILQCSLLWELNPMDNVKLLSIEKIHKNVVNSFGNWNLCAFPPQQFP